MLGFELAICASLGGPVAHAWLMIRRGYDSADARAVYGLDKPMDLACFAVAPPAALLYTLANLAFAVASRRGPGSSGGDP